MSSFGDVEPILKCPGLSPVSAAAAAASGIVMAALTADDDRMGEDEAARAAAAVLSGLPVLCGLELRLLCGLKYNTKFPFQL